jgi:hypothetical protein
MIFSKPRAISAAGMPSHILNLEYRHCEERSDEAIHLSLRAPWIASLTLAMTVSECSKMEPEIAG